MSPFAGPLFAAALLLWVAGIAKVTAPAATRVALRSAELPSRAWMVRILGGIEATIALLALSVGGTGPAALVALFYLGFAGFAVLLRRRTRGTASCGCFGATTGDAPVGPIHIGIDLAVAAAVTGAVIWPADGLSRVARDTPLWGVPFVGLTVLLSWLLYVSLTALPALVATMRPASSTSSTAAGTAPASGAAA